MDFISLISIIAAISGLLLIVFEVKGQIPISKGAFILILTIIVVIIVVAMVKPQGEEPTVIPTDSGQGTEENNDDTKSESSVPDEQNDSDESSVIFTETYSESDESITVMETALKNDNMIIVENIEDYPVDISPALIMEFPGEIVDKDQCDEYGYAAQISGIHRFEFSQLPNGTDVSLSIYNSGWEYINSTYIYDKGDGLSIELTAGETYYIRVKQFNNIGPYTLNIGPKKEIADITEYTMVSDSIQYTGQENDYMYVAKRTGKHRLEFSQLPNGTDVSLSIYNSGWEHIDSTYIYDKGDGLSIELTAGETYYIRVKQFNNIGTYTLNVDPKKEIVDITKYIIISDSIQYTDQENDYMYVAKKTGKHRLEFSQLPNGTDVSLSVYNSGWEHIDSTYIYDKGDEFTIELTAGETYYIRVEQFNNIGSYMLTMTM